MSAVRVRVDLLGPAQLLVDGQVVDAGGPKARAILAMLTLARGRVVSVDDLLDGVWGEDLPATARNTLQYHVTVIRKALAGAAEALATRDPGYALTADSDVSEFLRSAKSGDRARAAGDHAAAATAYVEGLNLWRGRPLADLREFGFAEARAVALEAQRLTAVEAWADAELASGHADAMIAPLQELVAENPTRERLWEALMLALYRTGRQDAALSSFLAARSALDRELGVEPSERLTALQQAILRQDPDLAPIPSVGGAARRFTSTTLVAPPAAAGAAVLLGPGGLRVVLGSTPVVIGRLAECEITLSDDQASRRHASIAPVDQGYAITDLRSTNGTFVNGVRIDTVTPLADGDRIDVGHSVVTFHQAG